MIQFNPAEVKLQKGIIKRTQKWEREHPETEGWRWDEVRAMPQTLMRMVIGGQIRIVTKTGSRTLYRLAEIDP